MQIQQIQIKLNVFWKNSSMTYTRGVSHYPMEQINAFFPLKQKLCWKKKLINDTS